jgi:hypothetical protein
MIDTTMLNQLFMDAISGQTTWLAASKRHPLDEFIETFYRTRQLSEKTLVDLTDAQVSYVIQGNPTWSISEMITHLIYSQNGYYNNILEMGETQLPHLVEAARGFGEGAKTGIPADELRANLKNATARITNAIEQTRKNYDPEKIVDTGPQLFGKADYPTWILLLLGHEVDHVRQGIVMRRAAKASTSITAADSEVE